LDNYINGLKPDIQMQIRMQQPETLTKAQSIAVNLDAIMQLCTKVNLNPKIGFQNQTTIIESQLLLQLDTK